MPTIRLATLADLRRITSKNVGDILKLPHLYIPTDDPDVVQGWGVAGTTGPDGESSVAEAERLFPGTLVAPCFVGKRVSRGDLLYHGAEPAADFL